jgi:RNA polymerase sigma-70 factor (ECF subfamily)
LLGSREDAEDAVQTTFINAQRGLRRGVVPKFELAWLFTIARNVCHNTRQSASRRGRVETARDLDAFQDVLATPERGGAVSISDLTRALAAIPERQRRALLLREWQGLSYEEIAEELHVSVAAVETLLFRARGSVARQLGGGTSRRADAYASVVALFRWLFKGGAGPLKIAAATATVATATTLAVVPAMRDHRGVRTPVAPQGDLVRPAPAATGAQRFVARDRPTRAALSPPVATPTDAPSAASPATGTSIRTTPPKSTASPPSQGSSPTVTVPNVTPTVTLPSLTTPTLTTPTLTVPELSLPSVELPAVELPLDTPKLPDVPKLP